EQEREQDPEVPEQTPRSAERYDKSRQERQVGQRHDHEPDGQLHHQFGVDHGSGIWICQNDEYENQIGSGGSRPADGRGEVDGKHQLSESRRKSHPSDLPKAVRRTTTIAKMSRPTPRPIINSSRSGRPMPVSRFSVTKRMITNAATPRAAADPNTLAQRGVAYRSSASEESVACVGLYAGCLAI